MYLKLNHKKLEIYQVSCALLKESYQLSYRLPTVEQFNLVQQIRRAALSVVLNIAEGASRKSPAERRRFYEIARGSVIEIDAALDASIILKLIGVDSTIEIGDLLVKAFRILSAMIKTLRN